MGIVRKNYFSEAKKMNVIPTKALGPRNRHMAAKRSAIGLGMEHYAYENQKGSHVSWFSKSTPEQKVKLANHLGLKEHPHFPGEYHGHDHSITTNEQGKIVLRTHKTDLSRQGIDEEIINSVDDIKPLLYEARTADDDQEQKKVRGSNTDSKGRVSTVKRKYLGNSRGRTATGKKAHVIDIEPVIGKTEKNPNRTTPSGPRRK